MDAIPANDASSLLPSPEASAHPRRIGNSPVFAAQKRFVSSMRSGEWLNGESDDSSLSLQYSEMMVQAVVHRAESVREVSTTVASPAACPMAAMLSPSRALSPDCSSTDDSGYLSTHYLSRLSLADGSPKAATCSHLDDVPSLTEEDDGCPEEGHYSLRLAEIIHEVKATPPSSPVKKMDEGLTSTQARRERRRRARERAEREECVQGIRVLSKEEAEVVAKEREARREKLRDKAKNVPEELAALCMPVPKPPRNWAVYGCQLPSKENLVELCRKTRAEVRGGEDECAENEKLI